MKDDDDGVDSERTASIASAGHRHSDDAGNSETATVGDGLVAVETSGRMKRFMRTVRQTGRGRGIASCLSADAVRVDDDGECKAVIN